MLLKNKTAVITGCSRGIGKQIVKTFSEHGANIYACIRNNNSDFKKFLDETEKKNKNTIIPVELDLDSTSSIEAAGKLIINGDSKIDILINNAGIIDNSLFQMTTIKTLKKLFEINYFSLTHFTQIILKSIIKNKKGSIIYISSTSGLDNVTGRNGYSSTKAAIISQAQTLSREVGRNNIRVNTIAPGLTETEMMRSNTSEKVINEVVSSLSLKRIGSTEEIANVALFLSSELSNYITGQTIRVDGGI
jgi:3-oxoacyl-[acyl-carrier protein] reductase